MNWCQWCLANIGSNHPCLNHRKACLREPNNELYIQRCIFIEPFFSTLHHHRVSVYPSGCVPSCFVAQNLWRCIWMRNTGRRPNELLRISTLIAPRWENKKHQKTNPTNEIPGELCGWKWFGVVRMDELMAFWHEFDVYGFLVMLWSSEGVVFSLECPIFWRLIKVHLLVRFVLLAQLAQLHACDLANGIVHCPSIVCHSK